MSSARDSHRRFRERLRDGETTIGIFVKTATHQVLEILGDVGLDYVVIDTEHAPFDRNMLDICLMTARAQALPALVRVPELSESAILAPLDMGAAGVMIPHVRTREEAEAAASYARYAGGGRGFSSSPRAGGYGRRGMADHIREADLETTVVAMIEDPTAIGNIEAIAGVDGIDALFLGRHDLAVSLGESTDAAPAVEAEVQKVYAAAPRFGKPIGALAPAAQFAALRQNGVRMFLFGTDQALLRAAVSDAAKAARQALA